jgi:hypothetical protein
MLEVMESAIHESRDRIVEALSRCVPEYQSTELRERSSEPEATILLVHKQQAASKAA